MRLLLCVSLPLLVLGFSYTPDDGKTLDEQWATEYPHCGGSRQSPINVMTDKLKAKKISPLKFSQSSPDATIENDGQTLRIKVTQSKNMILSGGPLKENYKLFQVHFHWGATDKDGSEHSFNGEKRPLEIHLVHMKASYETLEIAIAEKADDALVVVSVVGEMSSDNGPLNSVLLEAKELQGIDNRKMANFTLASVLPEETDKFYTYKGSLTTPPCNEIVDWIILEDEVNVSNDDLQILRDLVGFGDENMGGNYRPIQSNSQEVTLYDSSTKDGKDGSAAAGVLGSVLVLFFCMQ